LTIPHRRIFRGRWTSSAECFQNRSGLRIHEIPNNQRATSRFLHPYGNTEDLGEEAKGTHMSRRIAPKSHRPRRHQNASRNPPHLAHSHCESCWPARLQLVWRKPQRDMDLECPSRRAGISPCSSAAVHFERWLSSMPAQLQRSVPVLPSIGIEVQGSPPELPLGPAATLYLEPAQKLTILSKLLAGRTKFLPAQGGPQEFS